MTYHELMEVQLQRAEADLLRSVLTSFAELLMPAEARRGVRRADRIG